MTRRNTLTTTAVALALSSWLLPVPTMADQKGKPAGEDSEVKIGRENAAESDKQLKLITEPAIVDRVNRIGQEIAVIANTMKVPAHYGTSDVKQFSYSFKVIDDKDVNAFSLPGGFIYVHKGLLDYIHSDDELAAVLAHEIAHAAHHHMIKLIREQNKMQPWALVTILAVALAGKNKGQDAANAALGTQLFMTAKLNSMGVEAEKDADQTGIQYLTKTKYNPVGLMTFMERLSRDEENRPEQVLGIFQTHPPSPERARAAKEELESLNIAVNRRDVDPTLRAVASPASDNGTAVSVVKMYKKVIARLSAADGLTADQRGKSLADAINLLFDQGLQMYELHMAADKGRIIARGQVVVTFAQQDADAEKSTVPQLTQQCLDVIKNLLWQDQVNRPVGHEQL